MLVVRKGLLVAATLAGIAHVAGAGVVWAMVFFAGLAGYVVLADASMRVRAPLLAGLVLIAVTTLWWGTQPSEEFGMMSYGPSNEIETMLRRMAEEALATLAWTGSALLAGYACLLAAVWPLPRGRGIVPVVAASVVAVSFVVAGVLTLSDVDARAALWIAGLCLLVCLAIAAVAGRRAGRAWLALAGAALLAWQALDLLEGAAVSAASAALAIGPEIALPFGISAALYGLGIQQILLPAASLGGVLLVTLGCCLRTRPYAGGHPRMGPETMVSETA